MVRWIGLALMPQKTYDYRMCVRETDKDNKIVQREKIGDIGKIKSLSQFHVLKILSLTLTVFS